MLYLFVNIDFSKLMLTIILSTSVLLTSVNNQCWKSKITNVKILFSSSGVTELFNYVWIPFIGSPSFDIKAHMKKNTLQLEERLLEIKEDPLMKGIISGLSVTETQLNVNNMISQALH